MPWVRTKIAQLRVNAGLRSGRDAAKALGCSLIHVREIERGASGVSSEVAAKMAKVYKVSVADVLAAIRKARRSYHQEALKNL